MNIENTFTLIIVIVTLAGVSLGRFPVFLMNRATISFIGAAALIFTGALSLDNAYSAIDMNTIVLIFAMMILNANFSLSGFFKLLAAKVIKYGKTPKILLFIIIVLSGVLSAFFLNDTIVIMFTPLLLEITIALDLNPIPYLVALATSANVGSAATIIGNPQNMIIGVKSGISFLKFMSFLAPVSLIGLLVVWLVIIIIYKKEFIPKTFKEIPIDKKNISKPLLYKSIISLLMMITALILGVHITVSALLAASFLLFTRRIKPERVFREIDWSLLIFFSSLFIVTSALNSFFVGRFAYFIQGGNSSQAVMKFTFLSVILSNLISNVPAVLVLSPFVGITSRPEIMWLVLAMATTFAGNLTLLGSVANLIVAESAKRRGVIIKFTEYLKAGIPITVITIFLGIYWLLLF